MDEIKINAREDAITKLEWGIALSFFISIIGLIVLGFLKNQYGQILISGCYGFLILRLMLNYLQNKHSCSYDDSVVDFLTFWGNKSLNLKKIERVIQTSASTTKLAVGSKSYTVFGSPADIVKFMIFLKGLDIEASVESKEQRMLFNSMEKNYFIAFAGLAFFALLFLVIFAVI